MDENVPPVYFPVPNIELSKEKAVPKQLSSNKQSFLSVLSLVPKIGMNNHYYAPRTRNGSINSMAKTVKSTLTKKSGMCSQIL